MAEFHFFRPEWLVGVLAAPLVSWLVFRALNRLDPWARVCDRKLLVHLREDPKSRASLIPFVLAALIGSLCAFALAGPTWDYTSASIHRTMRARVVALDLSLSMNATDVAPSRMDVAREKAAEVFRRTTDDQVGIVVFAGDGFFIAPLTSDPSSLIGVLPAFSPAMIVAQGSRPDLGLREAGWLVKRAGAAGGEIVLIADGATGQRAIGAARRLWSEGIRVSVLAVGTEGGAQIPLRGGGFLRDLKGNEVVARTDMDVLRATAEAGGGRFAVADADSQDDIEYLLGESGPVNKEGADHDEGKEIRIWLDRGPWFAVLLLPLALLAFRRGWLFVIPCALLLPPADVLAQTGEFEAGRGAVAAQSAQAADPAGRLDWRWQGIEYYQQSRYMEAAAMFSQGRLAVDHYNRGNALARAGFYRAAVAAFGEAIAQEEDHADARFNRALVERLVDEEERLRREAGRGATRRATAENAEMSGDGQTHQTTVSPAPTQEPEPAEAAPQPQREAPPGGRESDIVRAVAPAEPRTTGEAAGRHVLARIPLAATGKLNAGEMERLEQTLENIAEGRLGLWRRKIEQQWRNNKRRDLRKSDSW